jgi:chromosomal replication initiator protein
VSGQLEFGDEDLVDTFRRAWELCLHLLASKVPVVPFETYIRTLQPISREGNVVTLGVSSPFYRERLEKNHANQIRSALEFHLDTTGLEIRFVILSRETQRASEHSRKAAPESQPALFGEGEFDGLTDAPEKPPAVAQQHANAARTERAQTPGTRSSARKTIPKAEPKRAELESLPIPCLALNEKYTFRTFLTGRSNRLAHAGALQVAARPGEVYNPLFLYGGPGLGKTHLLHGIAHAIKETQPDARIAYVSGEYFAQHYISALRDHATETFRRQYRQVDVWLVDDIQFIAGKEHTKEEFFHTFNTLYQSGKQIVLASDRSPRELNTMDERLRSRFQSGLIADIGPPELETRIAILQQFCQRENVRVSDDVLSYIASAIQSNIRALEGALTKLIAYSSIMSAPVSQEMARDVLSEYFIEKPIPSRRLTLDDVVEAVAERFGTTPAVLKGPNRNKEISLARQIAMYLCRELMPEMSTSLTGAAFGGRDHATVVYACQRMKALLQVDPEMQNLVNDLKKQLLR